MTHDLATRKHWDEEHGRSTAVPDWSDVRPERVLRSFIAKNLEPKPGQQLIELGAGDTAYLPRLAKEFGYRVSGLDYSPLGVELAQRNLAAAGVDGEIVEGDIFDPPDGWVRKFDVVITIGVVEHFDDTASVIRACAQYLAPNGSMLTLVPNMHGLSGLATRYLSRELYDRHVPLTPRELATAHTDAGLNVRIATYLAGINMWVANPAASPSRVRRLTFLPALAMTKFAWKVEDLGLEIRPNPLTSPWVVVVAGH